MLALAAVVRDLAARATESELAAGEGQLYERARSLLACELGCALGIDAAAALEYIADHVASGRQAGPGPRGDGGG